MTTRLAVLGDSIAYGIGATRPADTLAPRLAARLGGLVETRVFAVPGADSSGLAAQVTDAVRWRPDLVVIVIGANDLTHLVPLERAAGRLGDAVRALRRAGAQVVVAPDLSIVVHVPVALRGLLRGGSERLRRAQAVETIEAGGRIADPDAATSAAFAADPTLFSADRFHPSSAGYALIADAVTPALRAAVADLAARRAPG